LVVNGVSVAIAMLGSRNATGDFVRTSNHLKCNTCVASFIFEIIFEICGACAAHVKSHQSAKSQL
jgi:hypothetical protein